MIYNIVQNYVKMWSRKIVSKYLNVKKKKKKIQTLKHSLLIALFYRCNGTKFINLAKLIS